MENEALLKLYLEKLRLLTLESLEEKKVESVLDALKQAMLRLEGEMSGYYYFGRGLLSNPSFKYFR